MNQDELVEIIWEARATGSGTLDLSAKGLTTLPPEIGYLTELTDLKLENNRLTELPPEIGDLTRLGRLDLNRNRLR